MKFKDVDLQISFPTFHSFLFRKRIHQFFHPKCDTFCHRKHVETGFGEDERGPRGRDEKNVARHNVER